MCGLKLPKIMKNIVFIGNFNHAIFLPVVEALFLVKSQNSADLEISNLILNAYLGETRPGKNWRSVKLAGAPVVTRSEPVMGCLIVLQVITILPSDLVMIKVLSVTLEIRPKVFLKRMFKNLVMFCQFPVSLLSRLSLKCLNLKLPSHVNTGVLKKASLKTYIHTYFIS